jgi:hypothetical protein
MSTARASLGIERISESTALTALQYVGFVVGVAVTSMSMSSGFIWAMQDKVTHTYVAGFFAWTGYVLAHYAVTGVFVDERTETEEFEAEATETDDGGVGEAVATLVAVMRAEPVRTAIGIVGIVTLVAGVGTFTVFVSAENHLMGNLGGWLFLGGYAIAHYAETGLFL